MAAREIRVEKYIVKLTEVERTHLQVLLNKGKSPANSSGGGLKNLNTPCKQRPPKKNRSAVLNGKSIRKMGSFSS